MVPVLRSDDPAPKEKDSRAIRSMPVLRAETETGSELAPKKRANVIVPLVERLARRNDSNARGLLLPVRRSDNTAPKEKDSRSNCSMLSLPAKRNYVESAHSISLPALRSDVIVTIKSEPNF